MKVNQLVQNIKGDFLSSVVRPFIVQCGAIYIVHDEDHPAISLIKSAEKKALYSLSDLLTRNSIEFIVENIAGKPKDFSSRLSLKVGISVVSSSLSSSFWPERRTTYYIIYRPLRHGVFSGLKFMIKYFKEADQFFQAKMPQTRNRIANYLRGGIIHQVFINVNIYHARAHHFILSLGLTDQSLTQISDVVRELLPGNWGDYLAELFENDQNN